MNEYWKYWQPGEKGELALMEYVGPEYLLRRGDKYLRSIYRHASSGKIMATWSSKKWAMKFRPSKAGVKDLYEYYIEQVAKLFSDAVVEPVKKGEGVKN
jgi:hypothetical protein